MPQWGSPSGPERRWPDDPPGLPVELDPRPAVAGHRRARHSRPARSAARWSGVRLGLRIATALLSVLVLGASGWVWVTYRQLQSGLRRSDALSVLKGTPKSRHGDMNILLIGLDSRRDMDGNPLPRSVIANDLHAGDGSDIGGYNTNTLILLHVPGDGSKASAVSIPRDDYVAVPGYGMRKIKEAYGLAKADADERLYHQGITNQATKEQLARDAGRRSTLATLEQFLQVPIDHFAEVNLIGFYDLVSALGPIQVCLNGPVKDSYSGADFRGGVQTLNAAQALSFVRQRHGLPNGDLDRTHRQQAFIAAATHKLKTNGILSNLSKLGALINVAKKDVVIDTKLDPLAFAADATNLTSGHVTFYTLPIEGYATRNGQDVNLVDPAKARAEVHALFYPTKPSAPAKPTASATATTPTNAANETVDVFNGSSQNGLAASTIATLLAQGYLHGTIGDISAQPHTTVDYGPGAEADAALIGERYGSTAHADPRLPAGHIRVDLGQDASAANTLVRPRPLTTATPAIPTVGAQGPPIKTRGGIPCVN